jgi:hypothetical protein
MDRAVLQFSIYWTAISAGATLAMLARATVSTTNHFVRALLVIGCGVILRIANRAFRQFPTIEK